MDILTLDFKCKKEHSVDEFERQLSLQEDSLNCMTIEEYQNNMEKYHNYKNDKDSKESKDYKRAERNARQDARANEVTLKSDEYMDSGLSECDAVAQAEKELGGKDAIHTLDKVAGGNHQEVEGVGDLGVNRSIGAQWKGSGHAEKLENHVKEKVEAKEKELQERGLQGEEYQQELDNWKRETHLNVELVPIQEQNIKQNSNENTFKEATSQTEIQSRAPPEKSNNKISQSVADKQSNQETQTTDQAPSQSTNTGITQ